MPQIKKHLYSILFFTVFTTLLATPLVHASPDLNVTVNTSDYTYWVMHNVDIYGNLTRNGQLLPDGLVALEVKDPSGDTKVIRTVQTGTTLPEHTVTVTQITPMSQFWEPKDQFRKGETAYFLVFVNKTSPGQQLVLVTLSVYDAANVPLGWNMWQFTFLGQGEVAWTPNFQIPTWASTGTAKVIVGTYTDWPSAGGTPLGPENSSSFTIYELGGGGFSTGAQALSTLGTPGTYSLSFTTSIKAKRGIYTVYVTSSYEGKQATNSTTFLVDVPDINGDGYVNVVDLGLLSDAWLTESGEPGYNLNADFNEDGNINILDLGIMSDCWLWEAE